MSAAPQRWLELAAALKRRHDPAEDGGRETDRGGEQECSDVDRCVRESRQPVRNPGSQHWHARERGERRRAGGQQRQQQ